MNRLRNLYLLILLSISSPYYLSALNIFVKTTGNDSKSGLSYALAVKTITRAFVIAVPGDVILVDAGIYYERIIVPKSGTPGNYITLTNYNNGIVYIDGFGGNINPNESALMTISSKSYLKIYNIRFRNNIRADAKGIYLVGAGKEYHIANCQFYNIGWTSNKSTIPSSSNNANGILVQGSKADSIQILTISNNEIYNCITGYSECLTVTGNVRNFLIEGNIIHDNTNIGIDVAGHYSWTQAPVAVNVARNGTIRLNTVYNCVFPMNLDVASGIYVDGGKNIHVDRNRCFSNGCGISVGCEVNGFTVSNVRVRGNVVYNNRYVGILFGSNQPNSKVTLSGINNNTLYNNHVDEAKYTIYGTEIVLQNCSGNSIFQNILVPRTNTNVAIGCWNYTQTNNSLTYNLLWRTNGYIGNWYAGVGADPNAVFGNPKFKGASTGISADFHLLTGSKAINKGNPSFVIGLNELDFDGEARIQQQRCDIGADETNLISLSKEDLEERGADEVSATISTYPNPADNFVQISFAKGALKEIQVWDSFGRMIQRVLPPEDVLITTLDCSVWSPGVFGLNCQMSNGDWETKWVVIVH